MEEGPQAGSSSGLALSNGSVDLNMLDSFLLGDGWLEFPNSSDALQIDTPRSINSLDSLLNFSPLFEVSDSADPVLLESNSQVDTQRSAMPANPLIGETKMEDFDRTQVLDSNTIKQVMYSDQPCELENTSSRTDLGTSWWIQPSCSTTTVKERFMNALSYIKETQIAANILVQLWVPIKSGNQLVLTTCGQPFSLDPNCEKLVHYREVSTNYQFSVEWSSGGKLGLPGRVFLAKLPEWTPDVQFFSSYEYPRLSYAQHFNVRGSVALPVFEQGNCSCLGVVEVIMTMQKTNYTSELNSICSALQAVDLRSSGVSSIPHVKINSASYQAILPEILEVLTAVCKTHKLPLAQTWISCAQQGKRGSRHSDENYKYCFSTVDAASYVNDPSVLNFHEACSEHHLLRGQGVAGRAFMTNEPCFSSDIASSSKSEYPLSHHARMFNLKGAVAIRLRSTLTGTADFVLEFFLPTNCIEFEEQKLMLDSLSSTLQSFCQTLRVVTSKELEDEANLEISELNSSNAPFDMHVSNEVQGQEIIDHFSVRNYMAEPFVEGSSWITSLLQSKQKEPSLLEFGKNEIGGFTVSTHTSKLEGLLPSEKVFTEFSQLHQDLVKSNKESINGIHSFQNSRKTKEKRQMKTEKTVSFQVLRQYFAGSLKDAAKSLGVCPTTLKRICRRHGIARWPSRKIKKVDHSLKKLQLVIDSVHGADIELLTSLRKNVAKASKSANNVSGNRTSPPVSEKDHPDATKQQHPKSSHHTSSTSPSPTSGSQNSASSRSCCSGAKQSSQTADPRIENSDVDVHLPVPEAPICLTGSENHKSIGKRRSSVSPLSSQHNEDKCMRVKAMYGADKVRLRLEPTWSFKNMKEEIARRFSIPNSSSLNLKYLDDDSEWILLTCDADLQECIHVSRSANAPTIKISVHLVPNLSIKESSNSMHLLEC
ncbi:protein NLP5 [Typha angustifolia]|uniref:protein NLP5 n=1 Tax=Typha angustifolia TaxID=59011 RepID=UPI003C2E0695